jgi:restriction system protein
VDASDRCVTIASWQAGHVGDPRDALPSYQDLIYPTLRAVENLGGTAQAREITAQVLADIGASDDQLEVTYDSRSKSVLVDRIDWARSYAKLGGALDRPQRGLFVLSPLGKAILAMAENEGREKVRELDREVRARRRGKRPAVGMAIEVESEGPELEEAADTSWGEVLLTRIHRLSPDGFEEFVIYLLKSFGMELTRVGGSCKRSATNPRDRWGATSSLSFNAMLPRQVPSERSS